METCGRYEICSSLRVWHLPKTSVDGIRFRLSAVSLSLSLSPFLSLSLSLSLSLALSIFPQLRKPTYASLGYATLRHARLAYAGLSMEAMHGHHP